MNANEPLMRRRKDFVMSKSMDRGSIGRSGKVTQVLLLWHPAYRRHEFHLGFFLQLRDSTGRDDNRKSASAAMCEGEIREARQWCRPIRMSEEGW
jgi:hypothetical protein